MSVLCGASRTVYTPRSRVRWTLAVSLVKLERALLRRGL